MTGAKAVAVLAAAMVAVLLPSCTRTIDDARAVAGERTATAQADESACTVVDAPLVTIPTDVGEPVLKLPKPPGWERITEMDSEIVRYTIRNDSLSANAVVTLESVEGTGDPGEALDLVREGLLELLGADADLGITRHSLCGLTAETIEYINPGFGQMGPMPAKALDVVLMHEGTTHVASVNILTRSPGDPTYERDLETIITGFQMLPPSPS